MRLGYVRGSVVLSAAIPALRGTRLVIIEPVTAENLAARNGLGGGKTLVAADQLNPGQGQLVGFVEGRTAASPYYPQDMPIDAYCAAIVHNYEFTPPGLESELSSEVQS